MNIQMAATSLHTKYSENKIMRTVPLTVTFKNKYLGIKLTIEM